MHPLIAQTKFLNALHLMLVIFNIIEKSINLTVIIANSIIYIITYALYLAIREL